MRLMRLPASRAGEKGANFTYHDKEGKRIRDPSEFKRIRSLAIPPAWERVWICPQANGHLQATGIDAKGRKQHKYHPIWRTVRDEAKFERLLSFAEVLPKIRAQVAEEVDSQTLAKRNIVTAIEAVARLLGNTVAICRNCYIHPAIPTSYLDGTLARTLRVKADSQIAQHLHELKPEEAAVITLLRQELADRAENGRANHKR
jgi:DNA topoisomerase IB